MYILSNMASFYGVWLSSSQISGSLSDIAGFSPAEVSAPCSFSQSFGLADKFNGLDSLVWCLEKVPKISSPNGDWWCTIVDSVKCHLKQKNGENRGPNPNCRCIDSVCDLKIMGLSNKTHHLKIPPVSLLKLKRFVWSGCGGSPPKFSATVNKNNMKDDMFPTPPLRSLKLCEVELSPFPAIQWQKFPVIKFYIRNSKGKLCIIPSLKLTGFTKGT